MDVSANGGSGPEGIPIQQHWLFPEAGERKEGRKEGRKGGYLFPTGKGRDGKDIIHTHGRPKFTYHYHSSGTGGGGIIDGKRASKEERNTERRRKRPRNTLASRLDTTKWRSPTAGSCAVCGGGGIILSRTISYSFISWGCGGRKWGREAYCNYARAGTVYVAASLAETEVTV